MFKGEGCFVGVAAALLMSARGMAEGTTTTTTTAAAAATTTTTSARLRGLSRVPSVEA